MGRCGAWVVACALVALAADGDEGWPVSADGARLAGHVVVVGTVGADGRVTEARVQRSQPPGAFDAAALAAIATWTLEPGREKGKPAPRAFSQLLRYDPVVSDTLAEAGAQGAHQRESDLIPVERVEPQFPREALVRNISGWVLLRGIVGVDGGVRELHVERSHPPGVFDEAARRAVKRWRFKPRTKDGVAVERDFTQRLEFAMMGAAEQSRWNATSRLIATRRDAVGATYDRARGLCPDLYRRADDAVNAALSEALGTPPPLVLPDDIPAAIWAVSKVGDCVFSSWEQLDDPAAWVAAAELGSLMDPAITPDQLSGVRARARGADGASKRSLPLRLWTLTRVWDGYFELVHAHAKQFPPAPSIAAPAQDALDAANEQLSRLRTERALEILRAAYEGASSARDRAQLGLTLARVEAGRGRNAEAIAVLRQVVDLAETPWNLRQACRLALARLAGETGDAATFDAMLGAVNAELAVGERLAL